MERWFAKSCPVDGREIGREYGISPTFAKLLVVRGIRSKEKMEAFRHSADAALPSPSLLYQGERAAEILLEAIEAGLRLRIIGDYDVDGITSVYVYYRILTLLGGNVDYVIPDRVKDGYGISSSMIEECAEDGIHLILTCDTGISAGEEVEAAKEKGIRMIITDHHQVPFVEPQGGEKEYLLPDAEAVVDPAREEDTYPDRICGCVVAYQVMALLLEKAKEKKDSIVGKRAKSITIETFQEVAALATVCDVMELTGSNRSLVIRGIKQMEAGGNLGLQALREVTQLGQVSLSSYHLGFVLGPCLNASGRLSTARKGVALLLSESPEEARGLALELKEWNEERKRLTQEGVEKAKKLLEEPEYENEKVLVLFLPEVHESLAGIIAGRIRELTGKPTFVLTEGEWGIKGSGRSIPAYSMYEKLSDCKDLLEHFGGHPMAAGLSMAYDRMEAFRDRMNAGAGLQEEDLDQRVDLDMALSLGEITLGFIQELKLLEPFGNGNPKPLFGAKDLRVRRAVLLGAKGNVLRLTLQEMTPKGPVELEGVIFGQETIEDFMQRMTIKWGEDALDQLLSGNLTQVYLDVAYTPEINVYQGRQYLQLRIRHFK